VVVDGGSGLPKFPLRPSAGPSRTQRRRGTAYTRTQFNSSALRVCECSYASGSGASSELKAAKHIKHTNERCGSGEGRIVIAAFGVELIQREAVGMVVHVLVGIMFRAGRAMRGRGGTRGGRQ
jgi:hypothetical protein